MATADANQNCVTIIRHSLFNVAASSFDSALFESPVSWRVVKSLFLPGVTVEPQSTTDSEERSNSCTLRDKGGSYRSNNGNKCVPGGVNSDI